MSVAEVKNGVPIFHSASSWCGVYLCSPTTLRFYKIKESKVVGACTMTGEMRNAYAALVGKREEHKRRE
jgi:hypothetical protein